MQLDTELDLDLFDPLDKPGDIEKAVLHGKVQKIHLVDNNFKEKNSKQFLILANIVYCNCCQLPKPTPNIVKPYPYCITDKKLKAIGAGTYLFLLFIRFTIMILGIATALSGIPQMATSIQYYNELQHFCNITLNPKVNASYCGKYNTTNVSSWLYAMSFENLKNYRLAVNDTNKTYTESITLDLSFLNFLAILLMFLANLSAIIKVYCFLKDEDESKITPSDYTLMISGVPQYKKKTEIMDYLAIIDEQLVEVRDPETGDVTGTELREVEIKPIDIIMTYRINDIMKKKNKLLDVCKKIRYCIFKGDGMFKTGCLFCKKKKTIEYYIEKRESLRKALHQKLDEKLREPTPVIFAIFNKQTDRDNYQEKFPKSMIKYLYFEFKILLQKVICKKDDSSDAKRKGLRHLKVASAPEPEDIIWSNIQFTKKEKLKTVFFIYGISFFLILVSFGVIILLTLSQNSFDLKKEKSNTFTIDYSLSICISIVITIINVLIKFFLMLLSEREKYISAEGFNLTKTVKLTTVRIN
jgi:hypothetical protein